MSVNTSYPGADRNSVTNQVAAIAAASLRRLPAGVNPPVVQTFDPNSQPIIQFGIYSSAGALSGVSEYIQDTLTPALQRVTGVADVSLDGAPSRQFQVLLSPDKLQFYNLTPSTVVNSISSTSINAPIGTITHQNSTLTFSTENVSGSINQIREVLVDSRRGIKVSDLGTVRDVPVSSDIARVNGIPVVLVSVQKTSDSNSIAVAASPILYRFCGFSFNLVSLLALIIAIGIAVDDSIVVAENVERYRVAGIGQKEAVLKGASEVFSAVVAASLSLLSVLVPVSFMGGFIGRYLQQFSLGLAAAVFFSLLEAVLFLTVRLAFTPADRPHTWKNFFANIPGLSEAFKWGFTNFRKPFGIVFALIGALILVFFKLYLFLFGLFIYPVLLGIGKYLLTLFLSFAEALTAMDSINTAAGKIEAYLLDQKEVVSVQTVVGGNARMLVGLVENRKRRSVFALSPVYRKALAPIRSCSCPAGRREL